MFISRIQYGLLILIVSISSGCTMLRPKATSDYKEQLAAMDKEMQSNAGLNEYGLREDQFPLYHKPLENQLSTLDIEFTSKDASTKGHIVDKSDTWLKRNFW